MKDLKKKTGGGWNRGLTKETDERVARNAAGISKGTKGCKRKPHSEERKAKIGTSMEKYYQENPGKHKRECSVPLKEGDHRRDRKGKTYEEYYGADRGEKLRAGKRHPMALEVRARIAISVSKRVMDGTLGIDKFYKNGWVVLDRLGIKVYYRSSYELRALLLLDSYSDVIKVSSESIRIQYEKEDGSIHYYIPDLLVTIADGSSYIIEIKPNYLLEEKNNQIKFEAAKKYAVKHNMVFLIWTEDILFDEDGGMENGLFVESLSS